MLTVEIPHWLVILFASIWILRIALDLRLAWIKSKLKKETEKTGILQGQSLSQLKQIEKLLKRMK